MLTDDLHKLAIKAVDDAIKNGCNFGEGLHAYHNLAKIVINALVESKSYVISEYSDDYLHG